MDPQATVKVPPPDKKRKILLVEDEANIASMVVDWLSDKYVMVTADTGKAGVQKAVEEQPDLILEDIQLPDMTGYDVVKLLEKDSRTSRIPVVFLTGEKMVDETVKFIATVKNVRGYVNKPFRLQDFLQKIALIMDNKLEFIVMEKKSSTPEAQLKADRLREARAAGDREAAEPPPTQTSGKAAGAGPKRERGALGAAFSFFFRFGLWALWGALAAGAAVELSCRWSEDFLGRWMFIPPLAPVGAEAVPGGLPLGAVWEWNDVSYGANALGLRDGALPPAASTDSFRALALGGTPLFGQDVPLNGTFSKRLETLLNEAALFSSTGTHHVVHAGLWGASLSGQWATCEALIPRLKPDLIVWTPGDGPVRRPSLERLRKMRAWPPQLAAWTAESRLASLLEMAYLYGAPPDENAGPDLVGRVNRLMDANPGTTLVVLRLGRNDGLDALATRPNLLVFEVDKPLALDFTWKGLTPRGHERLASTAFAILQKYKDRVRPPAAPAVQAPAAPAPEPEKPRRTSAHKRRKSRRP